MTFKEIKSWAKKYGYEILKEKNKENYLWTKIDDPSVTGVAIGIRNAATEIYNHMTDNKWVEYQQQVKEEKKNKEIDHAEGYSF